MPEALPFPLQSIYERLTAVSAPVAQRYGVVAAVMQHTLSAAELTQWGQYCLQLAQCGWRTWESAETFVALSPFLASQLHGTTLWQWCEHGIALAQRSADAASAFFHAARPFLQRITADALAAWVNGGQWYLQQYPARPSLAAEYFRVSPLLYGRLPLPVCTLWGQVGQELVRRDVQYGPAFFAASRTLLERSVDSDPTLAWDIALHLTRSTPKVALAYLERYPDLLQSCGAASMERLHTVLLSWQTTAAEGETFLRYLNSTLPLLAVQERAQLLDWCQRLVAMSPSGMLALLRHLPELQRRLPGQRLAAWVEHGIAMAQRHAAAGPVYFALESASAHDRLRALQKPVVFADVERILQLYTEGLYGQRLLLKTTAALPMPSHALPTTNGTTIFVPEQVDEFAAAAENFAVYKVAILHQIGFYECGTFSFSMAAWLRTMPETIRRLLVLPVPSSNRASTAFEHFFAAFAQPALARQLFMILEDTRIDAYLTRRYKGIRQALAMVRQHALQQRPALQGMPLRQALLEGFLQISLGGSVAPQLPPVVGVLLQRLARYLQALQAVSATVYDTATSVVQCYYLLTAIPQQAAVDSLTDLAAQLPDDAEVIDLAELFRQAGEDGASLPTLPESNEPAQGLEPVPYRGDMKPELVQKQLRLQDLTDQLEGFQDAAHPLPPEVLKQLLEEGNIDIKSLQEGELSTTSGLFINDLQGKENAQRAGREAPVTLQQEIAALRAELDAAYGPLAIPGVLYDEWDYQIHDYRKRWCRLTETILPADDTTFVEETRQKYAELLSQVRQQFQLLKPEMFKKIKRLIDGEEIDLDSAIEALVDRRAGHMLSEAVYMRRNKRDRSVAALFLLDMSASTDDEVKESAAEATPTPPRLYDFSGFIQEDRYAYQPARSKTEPPRQRIIDVEKEALVLMAEALHGLGDAYAVYGFSGYGRDQVDFFIAKEFSERYDAQVQGRIAAIKPHRSTRMGAAIRHAIRKLERQEARLKALLLLSDGYPQDYDYGQDRKSKEYGLQDTMMALHEARLKGIQTFCITVDPSGHDYLRAMCPDAQYLVLENIATLPQELPKIYRSLTT